jgi:hypothetical protein
MHMPVFGVPSCAQVTVNYSRRSSTYPVWRRACIVSPVGQSAMILAAQPTLA